MDTEGLPSPRRTNSVAIIWRQSCMKMKYFINKITYWDTSCSWNTCKADWSCWSLITRRRMTWTYKEEFRCYQMVVYWSNNIQFPCESSNCISSFHSLSCLFHHFFFWQRLGTKGANKSVNRQGNVWISLLISLTKMISDSTFRLVGYHLSCLIKRDIRPSPHWLSERI